MPDTTATKDGFARCKLRWRLFLLVSLYFDFRLGLRLYMHNNFRNTKLLSIVAAVTITVTTHAASPAVPKSISAATASAATASDKVAMTKAKELNAAEAVLDVADQIATEARTLTDKTNVKVNDLLEFADDPGPASSVEFSGTEETANFRRKSVQVSDDIWSNDDPDYHDFEAVEVTVKAPIEHTSDDALFFEDLAVDVAPETVDSEPMFAEEEELGLPGVVYPQDQRVATRAKAKIKEDAAAEDVEESLQPVNRTASKPPSKEKATFVENAKEIQRRLVVDDESPVAVQSGDKWYTPSKGLTHVELGRRERIRECLDFYYSRMLNTRDDSPWSMMHHMVAWGTDSRIWIGAPGSRHESCIGWLCANGACEGERLLYVKNNLLKARTGPGLQGHVGQFLAMLAQTRVRADQPIQVNGELYTVKDLIKQEQLGCRPGTELTFKLIGLVHYLDTDASWVSSDGQQWDIQRLIREEMRQPINGTTCGGTHRLMGMTYAIRRREQEGKPVDGEFQRAVVFTKRYQHMAYDMQNANGTFSSDFWRSRGNWGDLDRKLKTTGHMLEWMVFSKSHEELTDPRILAAVDWLSQMMADNRYYDFEKGPLGHGIRALSLYDERVFGGVPGKRGYEVATAPPRLIARNPATKAKNKPPTATTTPQPRPQSRRGIFGGFRRK